MVWKSRRIAAAAVVVLSLALGALCQDWAKAVSLYNQKQYRDAAREFHAVLRGNPEIWQAWYYIGSSHFQLKGYEDAIDAFNNYIKAPGAGPKEQATANYFIGFSQYQLKQYDKAAPSLQKYITTMDGLKEKVDPSARAALGR